jgi:O-acetyl-ADP-ribose deacetylase (regulator of RNase III)
MFWRASEKSIRDSVRNAFRLIREHQFASVAFPIIGAGSGGISPEDALVFINDVALNEASGIPTLIVKYAPAR